MMYAVTLALILLINLWVAHCQDEPRRCAETNDQCELSPKIIISPRPVGPGVPYQFIHDNQTKVNITYGTPLTVACLGPNADKFTLSKNGTKLRPDFKCDIVIVWSTQQPDEPTAEYVCTDKENGCTLSVIIEVTPALVVIIPNYELSSGEYITQYGNSITLLCSGLDAAQLALTKDGQRLPTEYVNGTTIRWFVERPDLQKSEYVCTDVASSNNRSARITVEPAIYIEQGHKTKQYVYDPYSSMHVYNATYGDSIDIICVGPRSVKLVSPDENVKEIYAENINKTTIKLRKRNLKIGKLVYGCIETEVSDFMSTVRLEITPRIEVRSPSIQRIGKQYIIKHGAPLEISCTGSNAKLTLSKNGVVGKTEEFALDETTVKLTLKKPEIQSRFEVDEYECSAEETKSSVLVNVVPELEFSELRRIGTMLVGKAAVIV